MTIPILESNLDTPLQRSPPTERLGSQKERSGKEGRTNREIQTAGDTEDGREVGSGRKAGEDGTGPAKPKGWEGSGEGEEGCEAGNAGRPEEVERLNFVADANLPNGRPVIKQRGKMQRNSAQVVQGASPGPGSAKLSVVP